MGIDCAVAAGFAPAAWPGAPAAPAGASKPTMWTKNMTISRKLVAPAMRLPMMIWVTRAICSIEVLGVWLIDVLAFLLCGSDLGQTRVVLHRDGRAGESLLRS